MQRINRLRDIVGTLASHLGHLFIVLGILVVAANAQEDNSSSASNLLRLLAGNVRFVDGRPLPKDYLIERPSLVAGQHPYAIVLTCADSRLSPEILFDESLGKLYVVRTSGHVVGPVALGSIEAAIEQLHINLLFVLGHENCDTVKATISGGEAPPNIKALLRRIRPAVEKAYTQDVAEKDLLNAAIKENVRYQMQSALFESDVLSKLVLEKKLMMAGGIYNLHSGRVDLIVTDLVIAHNDSQHLAKEVPREQPATPTEKPIVEKPKLVKVESSPVAEKHKPEKTEHAPASEEPKTEKAERETVEEKQKTVAAPAHVGEEKSGEDSHKEEPKKTALSTTSDLMRLAENIRQAFQAKQSITLKKTMLMRDEKDRCITDDCRSVAAGESLSLDTPLILNVMGRPQLKVHHKGRSFYILADPAAIVVEVR
jgi:carbonic anhydrase